MNREVYNYVKLNNALKKSQVVQKIPLIFNTSHVENTLN